MQALRARISANGGAVVAMGSTDVDTLLASVGSSLSSGGGDVTESSRHTLPPSAVLKLLDARIDDAVRSYQDSDTAVVQQAAQEIPAEVG